MKFARSCFRAMLLAAVVGAIGACAFKSDRELWHYDGSEPVDLLPTAGYLPIQQRAESGRLLDYEARPNPYTALEGRIERDSIETYIEARRALIAEQYEESEQLLTRLVKQEPDLSGPWVMRGDIARAQGNLTQAMDHYAAAIQVNSINFNAWLRLAKTQRMRGHFKHAQNTYAKALELWPDGPELHLNLGVLYDVYLNQPLQAQAHMEAYELLSEDSNQQVAAWLEEIRQRTGVDKSLMVVGPEGELESISEQSAVTESSSSLTATGESEAKDLAATTSAEE